MRTLLLVVLAALPVLGQTRAEAEARLKARIDKLGQSAPVRITASQSASGPLLIAEVGAGESAQVLIERFVPASEAIIAPVASLNVRPILKQSAPILDFGFDGDQLIVLEPTRIVLAGSASTLSPAVPLPRDPRGRLLLTPGRIETRLPGTSCVGTTCKPDDSPWQEGGATVAWAPRRNYLIAADGKAASSVDDVARIESACATTLALAGEDAVQAFDSKGPVSARMPLPGTVVALWPAENPKEASLVVKNGATGEYEASRISVDCGR